MSANFWEMDGAIDRKARGLDFFLAETFRDQALNIRTKPNKRLERLAGE
jgi:hypothetical protein